MMLKKYYSLPDTANQIERIRSVTTEESNYTEVAV